MYYQQSPSCFEKPTAKADTTPRIHPILHFTRYFSAILYNLTHRQTLTPFLNNPTAPQKIIQNCNHILSTNSIFLPPSTIDYSNNKDEILPSRPNQIVHKLRMHCKYQKTEHLPIVAMRIRILYIDLRVSLRNNPPTWPHRTYYIPLYSRIWN